MSLRLLSGLKNSSGAGGVLMMEFDRGGQIALVSREALEADDPAPSCDEFSLRGHIGTFCAIAEGCALLWPDGRVRTFAKTWPVGGKRAPPDMRAATKPDQMCRPDGAASRNRLVGPA